MNQGIQNYYADLSETEYVYALPYRDYSTARSKELLPGNARLLFQRPSDWIPSTASIDFSMGLSYANRVKASGLDECLPSPTVLACWVKDDAPLDFANPMITLAYLPHTYPWLPPCAASLSVIGLHVLVQRVGFRQSPIMTTDETLGDYSSAKSTGSFRYSLAARKLDSARCQVFVADIGVGHIFLSYTAIEQRRESTEKTYRDVLNSIQILV